MTIEKCKRVYTVIEHQTNWTVKLDNCPIEVIYNVPKELCATAEELRAYVLDDELF